MVGPPAEVVLPEALLPEAEPLHLGVGVAKGRVGVGRAVEVELPELAQVGADDLVRVAEDDLLEAEREEDVEEEDLVGPGDALLLRLLVQPGGPLVGDKPTREFEREAAVSRG